MYGTVDFLTKEKYIYGFILLLKPAPKYSNKFFIDPCYVIPRPMLHPATEFYRNGVGRFWANLVTGKQTCTENKTYLAKVTRPIVLQYEIKVGSDLVSSLTDIVCLLFIILCWLDVDLRMSTCLFPGKKWADKYKFLQLISRWKHFYPAGRGLSEDDSAPSTGHKALLNRLKKYRGWK